MVWNRRRMIVAGLVGALLAAIITAFALNFVAGEKQIERKLEHLYTIDDPQFRRELGILLGPTIIDANRVTNLENGIEIFPAMLGAVKAARHNINFETYIYWSGDIGRAFAEALAERARAGVEVQVLIDWVGSQKMEQALLDLMVEARVHVERYHPLHWYHLARMNNRTHRKLLIVDRLMVSVGSTNFDNRSFRLNDEANLNIYDGEFAARVSDVFEDDLKRAHRITFEEWKARPWQKKMLEHAAALLSSQL